MLMEHSRCQPLSPYGVDKLTNDLYGELIARLYKFPVIGLRYFNIYGPRQDPKSDYAGVIGKFIDRSLSHQPIKINGDGEQTRNFVHVSDVAKINVAALLGEESFGDLHLDHFIQMNVGCVGNVTTINELVKIIQSEVGTTEVTHGIAASGDVKYSTPCLDVMRFMVPKISNEMVQLEEGIRDLVTYLRDQQVPRLIPKHLVNAFEIVQWPDE
jgi:UDP-glucose 4-epimerase